MLARAGSVGVGPGFDLGFGHQLNRLQQRGDAFLRAGRDRDRFDVAAVLGHDHAEIGKLLLDAIRVGQGVDAADIY